MPKNKITKKEIMNRSGYLFLGFFLFYLVDPIQLWVNNNLPFNPLLIGVTGVVLTLYFFDFE